MDKYRYITINNLIKVFGIVLSNIISPIAHHLYLRNVLPQQRTMNLTSDGKEPCVSRVQMSILNQFLFLYFMATTRTKLIIVPRWAGTPSSDWYPWIQGELAKHSPPIERVDVADMPNPTLPTIENWVGHLEKNFTDQVDENTIIIGHSVGNQSILRFLEKISKQGKPHFNLILFFF